LKRYEGRTTPKPSEAEQALDMLDWLWRPVRVSSRLDVKRWISNLITPTISTGHNMTRQNVASIDQHSAKKNVERGCLGGRSPRPIR